MLDALRNAMRIPDLRKKILFTFGLLVVYRVGSYIPVPGVDVGRLTALGAEGSIFGLLDLFAGGALSRFTVFALNVGPYITASIVMSLLQVVIPKLEELAKEGTEGRKKIAQYTRYATVVLGLVQGLSLAFIIGGAVPNPTFLTYVSITVTLTAGTVFLMWLGEQISEHGIGNGISLIIFAGIVARVPSAFFSMLRLGTAGISIFQMLFYAVIGLAVIVGVIFVQQGQRRIPVQYAKRVVGRRVMGGQSTHIPLRVNQAGVIPVIFAGAILSFPLTLAQFIPGLGGLANIFEGIGGTIIYSFLYALLIIFFTYFYTAITFNTVEVANNMKKNGGFIPGIRPGRPTAEYLDRVMTRITLAGAIFLAFIAILPFLMRGATGVAGLALGGTGLLIVVGVALETMKAIEAQLLMRHYEGFLK